MSPDRPSALFIRPARPGEGDILTGLCRRSKAVWNYDVQFLDAIADLLAVGEAVIAEGRVFVAEADGAPVGIYALRRWRGDRDTVELDALFVEPDAIGSGVGTALWRHLVATAAAWGAARVYIESDPNAVGFYRRMGAAATGERSAPRPPERALPILVYALKDSQHRSLDPNIPQPVGAVPDNKVEYFYAVLSPFCYLGTPSLREICARHGADLIYIPVDFFEVFKVSGGVPVHERAPQRQAYRLTEMRRWADYRGMPLNEHTKFFPADQTKASLMVLAALDSGRDPGDLNFAYQRAVWAEERDIADTDTVIAIADEAGFDGAALFARAQTHPIVAQYNANTQEAIARHLFGPPSYIFNGELFWGQDRLDFLDRALAAAGD